MNNLDEGVSAINTFIHVPLAERASIQGRPCVWIERLDLEHDQISQQLENSMNEAQDVYDRIITNGMGHQRGRVGAAFGFLASVPILLMIGVAGVAPVSVAALGVILAGAGVYRGVLYSEEDTRLDATRTAIEKFAKGWLMEVNWMKAERLSLQGELLNLKARIAKIEGSLFWRDASSLKSEYEQLLSLSVYFKKTAQEYLEHEKSEPSREKTTAKAVFVAMMALYMGAAISLV
jgi:hypothetical protein